MMRWPFREPAGLNFDQYHRMLRQRARVGDPAARRTLTKADRVAKLLTDAQRRSPDRSDWPDQAQLARAAELSGRQLRRLLKELDEIAAFVDHLRVLGAWGRLKLLVGAIRPARSRSVSE